MRAGSGRTARAAWERWTRLAHAIGNVQARVVLTLFYFVVVPPFALVLRLLGDPLRLRAMASSFWIERRATETSAEAARRQF